MSKYRVPSFIKSAAEEDSDAGKAARLLLSTPIGNKARLDILGELQITDTQTLATRMKVLQSLHQIVPITTNRQKDAHAVEIARRLNMNLNTPRTMLDLNAVGAQSDDSEILPLFGEPKESSSGVFYSTVQFENSK